MGGGALGLSAALRLAEEGRDVVLREKRTLGAGATHKAAGILSTMTWSDEEYALIAETRGAVGELISLGLCEGHLEAKDCWRPVTSIMVANGGDSRLDQIFNRLNRFTEEPERFQGRSAQAQVPGVEIGPQEEILVAQEDGVLDAGALVETLRRRAIAEGVRIEEGVEPTWDADRTVIAAGAWTRNILAARGATLPIRAFRTQLATLEMGEVPIVHDLVHGFYARPESETAFLAGDGTRLVDHNPDDYDESTDTLFRDHIASAVVKRFTGGGEAKWRTGWAGLCVATPDRHPMCGPVPGLEDVYVLTGDNGFGLMRCLALGDRLADTLRGRHHAWLDPGRFGALDDFVMREGFGDLGA